MPRLVSVLFAASNSVYKTLEDVDVFDKRRDARLFSGETPIVGHPPCRSWSAFCRHQAKPEPGEAELGLWCADQLRLCGGVLEQPAHSRLFDGARLPKPGERDGDLWTIEVWQAWWGYKLRKATWLCFSRVDQSLVQCPLRLHAPGRDRRRFQVMSKNQRAATCEPFARWLIEAARAAA
jgi:hypothetical protein